MKLIIRNSLKVVLAAAVVYVAVIFIFSNVIFIDRRMALFFIPNLQRNGGQELQMMHDLTSNHVKYNVVVLGSSHAYRGYDPRIFEREGLSLFNAGTSAQNAKGSLVLYNEYLKDRGDVFILDVYDPVFELEGTESNMRLIQNVPTNEAALALVQQEWEMYTLNALAVRLASLHPPDESPNADYVKNGFCEKKGILFAVDPLNDSVFDANEEMFVAFETMIKQMQVDGKRVVLCSHPLPASAGLHSYHDKFLERFTPFIQRYGLTYIDLTYYTEGFGLNEFADFSHLNQQGVELYNRLLLNTPSFNENVK
ncbi:MAG: hypothetical protein FJX90_01955 [Bacteroidetes bacterium]|nr:hypothetical protein [Bacteroidota bacterium]